MITYWPAIILSLSLHFALIALVLLGWQQKPNEELIKPPAYIKATLIDLEVQSKQSAKKVQAAPKKIESDNNRKQQESLNKLAREQTRKKQLALEKAAKQKKLKEQRLAEQKKTQLQRQKLERQLFEENLLKEKERLEAEEQAESLARQIEDDKLLSQSYSMLIQQRIQQNWSRPLSARNNMEALLTIQLIPTGEVIDVAITNGSGNEAFDRSAVQAVEKVGQFTELRNMPSRIFEKDFRKFQLIFKPQDLRQ